MNHDLTKINKIEAMLAAGSSHQLIQDVLELNHTVAEILAEFEQRKDFLTTVQVSELLTKELKGKVTGSFDTQKVNRLRKDGLLQAVDSNPSKRVGYRYEISEVQRFISDQLISKDELLQQRNADSEKIAVLEEKLEKARKEIASVKEKNKKLNEKIKENEQEKG